MRKCNLLFASAQRNFCNLALKVSNAQRNFRNCTLEVSEVQRNFRDIFLKWSAAQLSQHIFKVERSATSATYFQSGDQNNFFVTI